MASGREVVGVKIDKAKLLEVDNLLSGIKRDSADACKLAINKTVTGTTTDVKKAVAEVVNLKQARIAGDIDNKKATKLQLSAAVWSKGKKVELIEFGAKIVKAGVQYQIERNKGKSVASDMFIARGESSGDLHVMKRTSKVGTGKAIGVQKAGYYWTFPQWWPAEMRYPAHIKYGPSIPQIWGKPLVLEDTLKKANDRLSVELDRAVNKLLADAEKAQSSGWEE